MKLSIALVLIFVVLASADDDHQDLMGFFEKYGSGSCSEEKINLLEKQDDNCTEHEESKIQEDWDDEWCTYIENILKCMDPYKECYGSAEMMKLNTTILKFTVGIMEQVDKDFVKLKGCSIYLDLVGTSGNYENSGNYERVGLLVILFGAALFFLH